MFKSLPASPPLKRKEKKKKKVRKERGKLRLVTHFRKQLEIKQYFRLICFFKVTSKQCLSCISMCITKYLFILSNAYLEDPEIIHFSYL